MTDQESEYEFTFEKFYEALDDEVEQVMGQVTGEK